MIKVNDFFLDEEQTKPIIENAKISLIIAGAGTGKTTFIVGKVKYLLEHFCKQEEILCLSFTNETVNNLKASIYQNCHCSIDVKTFHKLALDILQGEYAIINPHSLETTIDEFFLSHCFGNETLEKYILKKFFFRVKSKHWKKIINSKELQLYKKTILTFINLFNSNDYTIDDLKILLKNKKYQKDLLIIYAILMIYNNEKAAVNKIDFNDMIKLATEKLNYSLPYKYIIIDEFQDTSLVRFNLIRKIVSLNKASLCVVGDDYQSIYRFSGCDINIFLNFQEYYPEAILYKLEKTRRNSLELITTASNFIMKNKKQIPKKLTSDKHLKNPIYLVYSNNKRKILLKLIKKIPKDKEILILGRTNYDLKTYIDYESLENNYIKIKNLEEHKIRYLTIHKSKGLESDTVILLNVENSKYGIPIKYPSEKILDLILKKDTYPFEEERRLFYVALTRTKNEIYLIVPKENPSIFIKEIKNKAKKIRL